MIFGSISFMHFLLNPVINRKIISNILIFKAHKIMLPCYPPVIFPVIFLLFPCYFSQFFMKKLFFFPHKFTP